MTSAETLLLRRSDVARLASARDYYDAVAAGFRAYAEGLVDAPPPMAVDGRGGAFHVKGAAMDIGGRRLAAIKANGNFPQNSKEGLPTIQGLILLSDAETGALLAVMDSIEVTLRRTAAASAVATNLLARPAAKTLLICGCGAQARAHLDALTPLRPFQRIFAFDAVPGKAREFAEGAGVARLAIEPVNDLASAAAESDVIVTVTTATSPLPLPSALRPGTFIAAVGADNPSKNELAPALMAQSAVIADVTAQAEAMGDLRSAIAAGAMTSKDVRAELGDLLVGACAGRRNEDEIVIFDSTGAAFQDLTSAAMIHQRARAAGIGLFVDLQR